MRKTGQRAKRTRGSGETKQPGGEKKNRCASQNISSTICQQTNKETDLPNINLPTGQLTNRYAEYQLNHLSTDKQIY